MGMPTLYGVLWDPEGISIALINDEELQVGNMMGEYILKEIREDSVILMYGGEPLVLRISFDESDLKTPADNGR